jgi:hypothetical protein
LLLAPCQQGKDPAKPAKGEPKKQPAIWATQVGEQAA